ncbi:U-box domain-containing protein 51-like [Cynara cardunculus var. scolymus]|uniref:U-box domain-containing protein 51-like n=1 Tax=Cynara cardunculus var. scolymus TaxID=59895 RepID=UPI000D626ADC|nr:U-box domain-containing protein 51-like [Cynara cardunculus var. scolymus]
MIHTSSHENDGSLGMPNPPMNQVAVGIDDDKHSPHAVRYAIDNLMFNNSSILLVHVKVPRFNSHVSAGNGKYESSDFETQQLFNRFRTFCTLKQIPVTNVLLIDNDVPKAVVAYVRENKIENLVLGASTRSGIARKFKSSHVPYTIMKRVPDFCSVLVISKGKVVERRLATRTLVNLSAPPKLSTSSNLEEDRPAPMSGDHKNSPNTNRPQKSTGTVSTENIELPKGGKSPSALLGVEIPATVPFGSMDLIGHDLDFNLASNFNESRSSTSSSPSDIEADMRRLKLELKQTMEMYNEAYKEAIAAKKQASELHQFQMQDACRIEQARLSEEEAAKIVEMEKAKCKAAMEAAEKAKKLAEIEAKRRKHAELMAEKAKKQSNNHVFYRKYTIEEIEEATNNFEPLLKIGEGGYGPVFKGKLDHTPVAIKVLRPDAAQGEKQFQQEVEILSRLRHPNLVLLLGACPEYGCLVYEFMNYGSLEDRLLRKGNSPSIPWETRFRIAADIGTGLLFLHQDKPEPLVHRDLKPGNILLDCNYVCKIADIGLARLVPPSVADSVTQYYMTSAAGTFCYIDPEYQQTGMLGVKSDIYALGVILLQIITARSPMGLTHQVGRAISKGTFADMLDPTVPDWPVEEALRFAKLALKCAELRKKDRPDLGSCILPELDRIKDLGMSSRLSKDDNHRPVPHSRDPSPRESSPYSYQLDS